MKKQKRIKELKGEGCSEADTFLRIKAEFPYSTQTYNSEQKIRELYREIEDE